MKNRPQLLPRFPQPLRNNFRMPNHRHKVGVAVPPRHSKNCRRNSTSPDEGIVLEDVEKKLIHRAIEKAGGNKSKAAKLLGITRRKLYSMLERLG